MIDLKVLVKNFNCEERSCMFMLYWNPRGFFSRIRKNKIFIRKKFRKMDRYYYIPILYYNLQRATTPCCLGLQHEKGTGEFRFGSGSIPCGPIISGLNKKTIYKYMKKENRRIPDIYYNI